MGNGREWRVGKEELEEDFECAGIQSPFPESTRAASIWTHRGTDAGWIQGLSGCSDGLEAPVPEPSAGRGDIALFWK